MMSFYFSHPVENLVQVSYSCNFPFNKYSILMSQFISVSKVMILDEGDLNKTLEVKIKISNVFVNKLKSVFLHINYLKGRK